MGFVITRTMSPTITLTTDFGESSPYVAVMKGVILSINPDARIVDLSHHIRPQDIRHANYFLSTAIPYFPPGTIHVAVVDPGVGSDRAALMIQVGGQTLTGPDNGIFTSVLHRLGEPVVRCLSSRQYWREHISDAFHGRDIFAPVAAHLSQGIGPAELGPVVHDYVKLPTHSAVRWHDRCEGEIQFIDDFGNLITTIPTEMVKSLPVKVAIGKEVEHVLRWVKTYADAAPGELVCLFSSDGFFEIAEVNGNAAKRLAVDVGTVIDLHFE